MINTYQNLLFIATVLVLCVFSIVHIFWLPLYGINPKPGVTRTFADFEHEKSLCWHNLTHEQLWRRQRCPQGGIVTVMQGGRLGNQIWEYVSVWGVARRTGLEPYVPRCIRDRLDQVFESLTLPTLDEIAHCPVNENTFVNSLGMWNYTNQSILLPRYTCLEEVVLTWVQDLFQEFTFKKKLRDKSWQVLRMASKLTNITRNDSSLYVGIHVRRTDYREFLWKYFKPSVLAEPKYFYTAMEYFEKKYPSVVFIVLSDDPGWCIQHLGSKKNVYVAGRNSPSTPEQDLAILAACNHTIISYGTYGIWGALLAGGETIFYSISPRYLSERIAELLPHWHVIS